MAIFNSYVSHYQRVHGIFPAVCGSFRGGPHEDGRRARPGMPRSCFVLTHDGSIVLVYMQHKGGILMGSMLPYIAYMDPMGNDMDFDACSWILADFNSDIN